MKHEIYLPSKIDQLNLHVLWMEPEGKPKGILQFCHGMSEHKERYMSVMEYFCQRGYVVVVHDHRGHGKSIKDQGDLGYFYDMTGNAIIEDAHLITQWMHEKYKDLPIHLFGHSMGSLVVRCYTKEYDNILTSLTVCGSPSKNPAAKLALRLAKLACKGKGKYRKGKFFDKIALSSYGKMLPDGEESWISYNKENVKKYKENPLDGFMFTNNGFLNLFYLMVRTYERKDWKVKQPDLPILFIAGEDDPCIESKKKFQEAVDFMRKVGYKRIEAKLFENRRHEILNENQPEEIYEVLEDFIQRTGD